MKRKIRLILTVFVLNLIFCESANISPKLDFDEPKSSYHQTINDGGGGRGGGGSTNTVSITKETDKQSIETDIVVHIKTKVNNEMTRINNNNRSTSTVQLVDNNNNDNNEPDVNIPVVVGYAGVAKDRKAQQHHHNHQSRINNHVDPSRNLYQQSSPTLVVLPATSTETNINNYYYQRYSPPSPLNHNINNNNNYNNRPSTGVDLMLTPSRDDNDDIVVENLPYFEPSYNRHYFGEDAPPALLRRRPSHGFVPSSRRNPVEFNINNMPSSASFVPNQISNRRYYYPSTLIKQGGDNGCGCNVDNNRRVDRFGGIPEYGRVDADRNQGSTSNGQQTHYIDGKLASLN